MGMKDEFWEARDWVRDKLSYSHASEVSVFETTIRELGGLLSAYDLSGDDIFKTKVCGGGVVYHQHVPCFLHDSSLVCVCPGMC